MRYSVWASVSPLSRGFVNVTASALSTTRVKKSAEVAFHSDAPFGPWKVTRPVRAWMARSSAVRSEYPIRTLGFRLMASKSRCGRMRAHPQPPRTGSTAFTEGSVNIAITSAARSRSLPASEPRRSSRCAPRFATRPSAVSVSSTMSTSIGSHVALAGSTRPTTSPAASRAGRSRSGAAGTAGRGGRLAAAGRPDANAAPAAPAAKPTSARRDTAGGDSRFTTVSLYAKPLAHAVGP